MDARHLRRDALEIWAAGVAAVDSAELVRNTIRLNPQILSIGETELPLSQIGRIEIVGAGKAGTGMALGAQDALTSIPPNIQVSGWVNVPEDCLPRKEQTTGLIHSSRVHLHPARPAGINEPTRQAVNGTTEILRRVSALNHNDVCIVLISGGGSALLCQPVPEISLAEKLQVTRLLASGGANINELNCVRTHLSMVKGGGLRKACRAGHLFTLIISDVIGDPVSVIASGPTVETRSSAADAITVLKQRGLWDSPATPASILAYLRKRADMPPEINTPAGGTRSFNLVIGNNRSAIEASSKAALALGYQMVEPEFDQQGDAASEGYRLQMALQGIRDAAPNRKFCLLSGGEPTVQLKALPAGAPRKGGRNQELVLAAINASRDPDNWKNIALLSGGTDGEDGPTDAAGAVADAELVRRMQSSQLDPADFLLVNNSYPFFEQLDGLVKSGPTHTNVMDLRVGLTGRQD
ncbi:MAG: DUF4147 domain-containing protein [Planctomycetaceae bacterium]